MLTFGQYNTLAATRYRATQDQLTSQTKFNALMVSYYVAGLLANELLTSVRIGDVTYYELTDFGLSCLTDYERHNPELAVTRSLNLISFD